MTAAPPPAPPAALAYSAENCTLGRAMEVLGERWVVIVLREVFNGIRRFDDLRVRTSIPRQVLTDRLSLLMEHEILRKEPYQVPGERARHEYRLTRKGIDLYQVLIAVADWGNRYLADADGPPITFVHAGCGASMRPVLECAEGHRVDDPRQVVPRPGPGARLRV